jgi:SSS family solute:Na+ symporter
MQTAGPWLVLAAFSTLTWWATPRRVNAAQFFDGRRDGGQPPGVLMVAMSAAITWVFAKSIANASDLAYGYGLTGGIGYTLYYLSFVVAGVAIYLLRSRGGYVSLPHFLVSKYGARAAKLFMVLVTFRLVNEIWSNTKVMSLYFGLEGSGSYWAAVVLITGFTVAYAWRGGMRASLTTDRIHIFLAFVLLALVLAVLFPGLEAKGIPTVAQATRDSGITFCLLAVVQVFSYPFHDPVLTDRGFLNRPSQALRSFLLAAVLSGTFIFLFSLIGLYGLAFGLAKPPAVTVPGTFGLAMLMVFNAIMLMTGGSTIDSTLTSIAKLTGRDWRNDVLEAAPGQVTTGRLAMVVVAVVGNLPLLTLYLGDKVGPAIIAATTISGTMVMGLAPIFLLSWLRPAGGVSFHMAFWPGVVIGVIRAVETFGRLQVFPDLVKLGSGPFALDLGVNAWGLGLCAVGFVSGALLAPRSANNVAFAERA